MTIALRAAAGASLLTLALAAAPLHAATSDDPPPPPEDQSRPEIVVTGHSLAQPATQSQATISADRIAQTVNAVNVEDALKYLPSLVVRKRNIGDTQAPLATRTSGLGASARSLIYADGALLSALLANNNTIASPRWGLVSPEEIERIDILYGPYSAAYAGNSIGAVVNITTRLPDKLQVNAALLTSQQDFDLYGTHHVFPTYQGSLSVGDRFGPLAMFLSATHTDSKSQPISFVTAARPAASGSAGTLATGSYDDVNRMGAPIRVLGAGGLEHHRQTQLKAKLAFDLSPSTRLTYVGGLFLDDTSGTAQTYLDQSGTPVWSGSLNLGGYAYTVSPTAFTSSLYQREARHWQHALSAEGGNKLVAWKLIGTLYDYARDDQRTPGGATPAAFNGGAGNLTRMNGTGWSTFDGHVTWRNDAQATSTLTLGAHWDRVTLESDRYTLTDWIGGVPGVLNQASRGRTRTWALWAEEAYRLSPNVTLTLGGRQEWWQAGRGYNFSAAPLLAVTQLERQASGFSPKASFEWKPAPGWSARLSIGRAYRFPTVGELYQAITTGTTLTVPDPTLRPERAWSGELSVRHSTAKGEIRLSLFDEVIRDALISQSAPLVPGSTTLYTYVQNVDRTRARGMELAITQRDVIPRVDLSGSVTYADAITSKDLAFPAAVGKQLPSVPHWKASAVLTWRPLPPVSLTAAARYSSRNFGQLDNSDVVGNTYQGFYRYFVLDLRARWQIDRRLALALGVDNLNNDKYFLFHPFPQRSVTAEARLSF